MSKRRPSGDNRRFDKIFDSLDLRGTGELTKKQFTAFLRKYLGEEFDERACDFYFRGTDIDNDGRVSRYELRELIDTITGDDQFSLSKLFFRAIDLDRDGAVDADEFVDLLALNGIEMTRKKAEKQIVGMSGGKRRATFSQLFGRLTGERFPPGIDPYDGRIDLTANETSASTTQSTTTSTTTSSAPVLKKAPHKGKHILPSSTSEKETDVTSTEIGSKGSSLNSEGGTASTSETTTVDLSSTDHSTDLDGAAAAVPVGGLMGVYGQRGSNLPPQPEARPINNLGAMQMPGGGQLHQQPVLRPAQQESGPVLVPPPQMGVGPGSLPTVAPVPEPIQPPAPEPVVPRPVPTPAPGQVVATGVASAPPSKSDILNKVMAILSGLLFFALLVVCAAYAVTLDKLLVDDKLSLGDVSVGFDCDAKRYYHDYCESNEKYFKYIKVASLLSPGVACCIFAIRELAAAYAYFMKVPKLDVFTGGPITRGFVYLVLGFNGIGLAWLVGFIGGILVVIFSLALIVVGYNIAVQRHMILGEVKV